MFVRSHMTEDVLTISAEANLQEALTRMKTHGYEGLPVVDADEQLVGIITVWDIHEALYAHILQGTDLTRDTLVKQVMSTKLITVMPEEIIESAAHLMETHDLWLLPVVTHQGQMVGVITQADIHRVFVEMLGLKKPGTRIMIRVDDKPGRLAELAGLVRDHNLSIISVATFQPEMDYRNVVLRVTGHNALPLVEDMRNRGYRVIHVSQVWE